MNKFLLIMSSIFFFSTGFFNEPAEAAKKKIHKTSLPTVRSATGNYVFIFNSRNLMWAVYDPAGNRIRVGHGVGGKDYCPDIRRGCKTPVGTFRIYDKQGPNFKSSKYPLPRGGAPMPYAMFFRGHYAIHGSNDVPNRHASHGCIRVHPGESKWLSHQLPLGSTVIVMAY